MSLKKFDENEVVTNTLKTHPSCEFFIYESKVYYNNTPQLSGAFSASILGVPTGYISLYEYNIDKITGSNNVILPFITKDSENLAFNTVSPAEWEFDYGEKMYGTYPMSASITREYMYPAAGKRTTTVHEDDSLPDRYTHPPLFPHYYALKNTLDSYASLNENFAVVGPRNKVGFHPWNKSKQRINLLSIPSIFYGTNIKPGTVSLKWYFTGSVIGELQDLKRNGVLYQTGPYGSRGSGSIAGVVLYDDGFVLLTGSWPLRTIAYVGAEGGLPLTQSTSDGIAQRVSASWLFYGAGAGDGVNSTTVAETDGSGEEDRGLGLSSASFGLSFKGHTETQVVTMFAQAKRGEVNYSNNPTFLTYGQEQLESTSSAYYEENDSRYIYNTVSASYKEYNAPFKRQVYISRIAVYDESENLLGIATLATPVLKEEDRDYTFKLRLDI